MGSDLYFYKLNPKGKDHLYTDLISNNKFKINFATFISNRASELGSGYKISYHQIIRSVWTDFNQMKPDHLWEIRMWYGNSAVGNDWRLSDDWLKNSGIELLFEISSSTSCYAFLFQYGNFSDRYKPDAVDEQDGDGSNIKAYDFVRFIEYVILLLCRINEAGLESAAEHTAFQYNEEYTNDAVLLIDKIRLAYKDDNELNQFVEDEFEYIKEKWLEHIEDLKKNSVEYISPDAYIVYDTNWFLGACCRMLLSITEENKNIVMIAAL